MEWQAFIVLGSIVFLIFALINDWLRPGIIFASVITLFLVLGIINSKEALAGFSNRAMITVAILYLVSEGIRQSGALDYLASILLPRKQRPIAQLLSFIMAPIAVISAFLNNTAVVIIFAPVIRKWAENIRLPASKFLIPLSYATILGGVCTLMGTSTNLVVDGMMRDAGFLGIGMFELTKVGGFVLIFGLIYLVVFANLLLPGKWIRGKDYANVDVAYKDYIFEVRVLKSGDLVGKKITNGETELLSDFHIESVTKEGRVIQTKEERILIRGNEILTLVGNSDGLQSLIDKPFIELTFKDRMPKEAWNKDKKQVEVVLAPRFPGIGKTLNDFDFYQHYQGIVIAIHRNGENITNLNDVILKEGDNLVLIANDQFINTWGRSRIFYIASKIGEYVAPKSFKRMWFASAIILMMILGVVFGEYLHLKNKVDMFIMSALAAMIMIWTKLLPAREYTKAISWDVLITIACAFGIAQAMHNSGLDKIVANYVITTLTENQHQLNPIIALGAIYFITSLFTELITNNAAAALTFPIALALAQQMNVDPRPFFIAICVSASASFATPIGYQTNLIVQGIGNYRFKDYIRIGLPLNILCFFVTIYVIPYFWKF